MEVIFHIIWKLFIILYGSYLSYYMEVIYHIIWKLSIILYGRYCDHILRMDRCLSGIYYREGIYHHYVEGIYPYYMRKIHLSLLCGRSFIILGIWAKVWLRILYGKVFIILYGRYLSYYMGGYLSPCRHMEDYLVILYREGMRTDILMEVIYQIIWKLFIILHGSVFFILYGSYFVNIQFMEVSRAYYMEVIYHIICQPKLFIHITHGSYLSYYMKVFIILYGR